MALGLEWLTRLPAGKPLAALFATVAITSGIYGAILSKPAHVVGYGTIVESIPHAPGLIPILICSDPRGDGAATVALRVSRNDIDYCLMRADKCFATSNWANSVYNLDLDTTEEIDQFLSKYTVKFILLDAWGRQTPHGQLLAQLLSQEQDRYEQINECEIERCIGDKLASGRIQLYRVNDNASIQIDRLELPSSAVPGDGSVEIFASKPGS